MIKNVYLKKIIKNSICKIMDGVNRIIPKNDNYILLYAANGGLKHNLKPLFNYLIKNGYNEKYTIFCGVKSKKYIGVIENNIKYCLPLKSIFVFLKSAHVFYTAGQIPIFPSKKQVVIHMNHGTCDYKTMGNLSPINNGNEFYFTYMLTTGEYYKPIVAKEYNCDISNVCVCSEPTTDCFYMPVVEKYDLGDYEKIFLWLPTFRKSDYYYQDDSSEESLLPALDEKDYDKLNEILELNNYKLIVKLHGAQKLDQYQISEYSNLFIYSDEDFGKLGYDLYQLLMQVDVLLGDYSSVSLQFLLLDKPLVYVIPDIEEYKNGRGFIFDKPEDFMPGTKIRNSKELFAFFENYNSSDDYYEERRRVKEIIHKYDDGKSCERILQISGITLDQ